MVINGVTIHDHERVDDLRRNGFKLIQDPSRFCFGTDAVLLADFVKASYKEDVIDLGTGNGIIPVLLAARGKGARITGLEITAESAELARRNVIFNNLQEKVFIDDGDILTAGARYGPAFTVACANPPYNEAESGVTGKLSGERHELLCTLTGLIRNAAALLKFGGRFYMVHKPQRLPDIFCSMRAHGLEAKTLRLVAAREGKPPSLALIGAVRGGKSGLTVMPHLVLHDSDGNYTAEADGIYNG